MKPTIVTVPCFSGAPWELDQFVSLRGWTLRTMRLPEALDSVDAYADFVDAQVADLDRCVLVGDSFGAVDTLIGERATRVMLDGIPDAAEVKLENTGHMFRFSHPTRYGCAVRDFMSSRIEPVVHKL